MSRRSAGDPVRLEIAGGSCDEIAELLRRALQLGTEDIHRVSGPLQLAELCDLLSELIPAV